MVYRIYGLYKEQESYSGFFDGLYYVGITSDLKRRSVEHRRAIAKKNPIRANHVKKYGCDVRILWTCDSQEEALSREEFLISWFGTIKEKTGCLTNILTRYNPICTYNKGRKFSKSHRSKMSNAAKNRSKEYLEKQRQSHLAKHGFDIEQIYDIIKEWELSCGGLPVTKSHILDKYNIKNPRFSWWIRRYRPDLRNFIEENKAKHVQLWKSSGLSQAKYGQSIGVNQRTISAWSKI